MATIPAESVAKDRVEQVGAAGTGELPQVIAASTGDDRGNEKAAAASQNLSPL